MRPTQRLWGGELKSWARGQEKVLTTIKSLVLKPLGSHNCEFLPSRMFTFGFKLMMSSERVLIYLVSLLCNTK